jgi:hypothetical protein
VALRVDDVGADPCVGPGIFSNWISGEQMGSPKSEPSESLWPFLILDKTENFYPINGNPENDGIALEYEVPDAFVFKIYRFPEAEWPIGYALNFPE